MYPLLILVLMIKVQLCLTRVGISQLRISKKRGRTLLTLQDSALLISSLVMPVERIRCSCCASTPKYTLLETSIEQAGDTTSASC
jgi:hypothetical protein